MRFAVLVGAITLCLTVACSGKEQAKPTLTPTPPAPTCGAILCVSPAVYDCAKEAMLTTTARGRAGDSLTVTYNVHTEGEGAKPGEDSSYSLDDEVPNIVHETYTTVTTTITFTVQGGEAITRTVTPKEECDYRV